MPKQKYKHCDSIKKNLFFSNTQQKPQQLLTSCVAMGLTHTLPMLFEGYNTHKLHPNQKNLEPTVLETMGSYLSLYPSTIAIFSFSLCMNPVTLPHNLLWPRGYCERGQIPPH